MRFFWWGKDDEKEKPVGNYSQLEVELGKSVDLTKGQKWKKAGRWGVAILATGYLAFAGTLIVKDLYHAIFNSGSLQVTEMKCDMKRQAEVLNCFGKKGVSEMGLKELTLFRFPTDYSGISVAGLDRLIIERMILTSDNKYIVRTYDELLNHLRMPKETPKMNIWVLDEGYFGDTRLKMEQRFHSDELFFPDHFPDGGVASLEQTITMVHGITHSTITNSNEKQREILKVGISPIIRKLYSSRNSPPKTIIRKREDGFEIPVRFKNPFANTKIYPGYLHNWEELSCDLMAAFLIPGADQIFHTSVPIEQMQEILAEAEPVFEKAYDPKWKENLVHVNYNLMEYKLGWSQLGSSIARALKWPGHLYLEASRRAERIRDWNEYIEKPIQQEKQESKNKSSRIYSGSSSVGVSGG